MLYKKRLAFLFFCIIFSFQCLAQHDLTLYSFGDFGIQSNHLNPAFVPKFKLHIGLPVISNFGLSVTSPVHVKDVYTPNPLTKQVYLDVNALYNRLAENNYLRVKTRSSLFNLGYRSRSFYIGLSAGLNVQNNLLLPKELFRIAADGIGVTNESLRNLFDSNSKLHDDGYSLDLNKFNINHSSYVDLALTYSHFISKSLTLGVRFKFLKGISNAELKNSNAYLERKVNQFDVKLKVNDISLRTSGINALIDSDDSQFESQIDYLTKSGNFGGAIDLGINLKLNERARLSASVLDLGFINWKSDVLFYEINDKEFLYEGIDVGDILINDKDVNDYLDSIKSQVKSDFKIIKRSGNYRTYIKSNFFVDFKYELFKFLDIGVNSRISNFANRIDIATGLYTNLKLGRSFIFNLNTNYTNRSALNVGTGLGVNIGFIQFMVLTDNILPVFFPFSSRNVDFRFGLNFLFGRNSFKKKKLKLPSNMQEINSVIN